MPKIVNCVQGSDEWLQERLGVATASNFDKVITSTGKESTQFDKYAFELASQLLMGKPEETYKNQAMARGNELEPIARQAYQEFSWNIVETIGMYKSDCGNFGYSPDGLVGEDGLIEIKCPQATTHLKYLVDDKLPSDYVAQVQGGLFISGRKWCDFISFHPDFKEKNLFVKRVLRDEDFISKLEANLIKTIALRDEILVKLGFTGE